MNDQAVTTLRYNTVAIILHWLMAIGFFFMLGSGIIMTYGGLEQAPQFALYQLHKSAGVILLLAFILRLLWRFFSLFRQQIPHLPQHLPNYEKVLAKLGHWALYFFMIAMPISGWFMVSASIYGLPTIVFDWFEWPHIPGLQGNEKVENWAKNAHFIFAIGFGLLIIGHIAAVIKHAKVDQHNLIYRMWWKSPN